MTKHHQREIFVSLCFYYAYSQLNSLNSHSPQSGSRIELLKFPHRAVCERHMAPASRNSNNALCFRMKLSGPGQQVKQAIYIQKVVCRLRWLSHRTPKGTSPLSRGRKERGRVLGEGRGDFKSLQQARVQAEERRHVTSEHKAPLSTISDSPLGQGTGPVEHGAFNEYFNNPELTQRPPTSPSPYFIYTFVSLYLLYLCISIYLGLNAHAGR